MAMVRKLNDVSPNFLEQLAARLPPDALIIDSKSHASDSLSGRSIARPQTLRDVQQIVLAAAEACVGIVGDLVRHPFVCGKPHSRTKGPSA